MTWWEIFQILLDKYQKRTGGLYCLQGIPKWQAFVESASTIYFYIFSFSFSLE
jgi:hypothetical protein